MSKSMRTLTLGAFFMLIVGTMPAAAQAPPRVEVAGGYAYLHEMDLSIPAGWFASGGANVNDWLGIVGAVSGHYKTESESGVDVSTRLHTFAVGPKFRSYKNPRVAPYAQVLFGGAHVSGSAKVPGTALNFSVSENGFDVQPGVGIDIKAGRSVAIRLGTNGDFIRSGGETSKEVQFIAGVVIQR